MAAELAFSSAPNRRRSQQHSSSPFEGVHSSVPSGCSTRCTHNHALKTPLTFTAKSSAAQFKPAQVTVEPNTADIFEMIHAIIQNPETSKHLQTAESFETHISQQLSIKMQGSGSTSLDAPSGSSDDGESSAIAAHYPQSFKTGVHPPAQIKRAAHTYFDVADDHDHDHHAPSLKKIVLNALGSGAMLSGLAPFLHLNKKMREVFLSGGHEHDHKVGLIDLDEAIHALYVIAKTAHKNPNHLYETFNEEAAELQKTPLDALAHVADAGGAVGMAISSVLSVGMCFAAFKAIQAGIAGMKEAKHHREDIKKHLADIEKARIPLDQLLKNLSNKAIQHQSNKRYIRFYMLNSNI